MLQYKFLYWLLCAAILFVWLGLNRRLAQRSALSAREHWKEAIGKVVLLDRSGDGASLPVVNFAVGERSVRGAPSFLSVGQDGILKVGDKVEVLYDPDEPSQFLLKDYAVLEGRLGLMFYCGVFFLVTLLSNHYQSVF